MYSYPIKFTELDREIVSEISDTPLWDGFGIRLHDFVLNHFQTLLFLPFYIVAWGEGDPTQYFFWAILLYEFIFRKGRVGLRYDQKKYVLRFFHPMNRYFKREAIPALATYLIIWLGLFAYLFQFYQPAEIWAMFLVFTVLFAVECLMRLLDEACVNYGPSGVLYFLGSDYIYQFDNDYWSEKIKFVEGTGYYKRWAFQMCLQYTFLNLIAVLFMLFFAALFIPAPLFSHYGGVPFWQKPGLFEHSVCLFVILFAPLMLLFGGSISSRNKPLAILYWKLACEKSSK